MITLISGSDTYRIREAVRLLVSDHGRECPCIPQRIDCADTDGADALVQALGTPSFLDSHRLVIARDPLAAADLSGRLAPWADARDVDLILVQPLDRKPSAAQTRELASLARVCAAIEHCEPLTEGHLPAWIAGFCSFRGRTIAPQASRELIERVGTDSWALAGELEKLCAYAESTITPEMVELLVARPPADDTWGIANALASHDKRGALAALWRKATEGTAMPLLVGSLASSVRTLLTVRGLRAQGMAPASIAKTAGVHPFVVSKNLRGTSAFDDASLAVALRTLAELDRDAKSGRTDGTDGLFAVLLALT